MLMSYLTAEEYSSLGGEIPSAEAELYINKASRHIDSLTFNRILGKGFENLSVFQQEIIKKVCFDMANFEFDNADMINSVLQSYAINGVSMQFGSSWNIAVVNGVAIRKDTYNLLMQTGLCYMGI